MSKNKKSSVESLFYNNKFLMVFSVIVAIVFWATVKVNYSAETTKTLHPTNITFNQKDYTAYYDKDNLDISVVIKGKSYIINSIKEEDIVIEASVSSVKVADGNTVTLNAKLRDDIYGADVTVAKISPMNIDVLFDKPDQGVFDVVPILNNDLNTLVSDNLVIGKLAPSIITVEVEGPASEIAKIKEVNLEGVIAADELPLQETKVVPANVSYKFSENANAKFLVCKEIDDSATTPTITVPVFIKAEVDTAVNFLGAPDAYGDSAPRYKVTPEKVTMLFATKEEVKDVVVVGDAYFAELSNTVNTFDCTPKDEVRADFVDQTIEKFTVTVDMSDMSMITLNKNPTKRVFLGGNENYTYTINYEKSELDAISIVGPWDKLQKITEADIQVNIDVSSLDPEKTGEQMVEVTKISIEGFDDCWAYGKYKAYISVEPKG